jgi:hypothetical protein
MALVLTTAPAAEPISLDEAKTNCERRGGHECASGRRVVLGRPGVVAAMSFRYAARVFHIVSVRPIGFGRF